MKTTNARPPTEEVVPTSPLIRSVQNWCPKLSANEVRRRFWHMAPGFVPFLAVPVPRPTGLVLIAAECAIAATGVGCTFIASRVYRLLARRNRFDDATNAVTYAVFALVLLACFPTQPQLAAVVVVILAFGDGSATLFGLMWGRKRLPWNPKKSWVGLFAFLAIAIPNSILIYWLLAVPNVSLATAVLCGGIPAAVCALVESWPVRCSDNLIVSGTAAGIVTLCYLVWGVR